MPTRIAGYLLGKCDLLMVVGFLVFVGLPLVVGLHREDVLSSGVERRNLAQLPPLPGNLEEIQSFPTRMDSYYSDQFGFRNALTRIYFRFFGLLASDSTGKNITAGKDGWLFLGSIKQGYADYADPMGDVMNINLYTEEQLLTFARYITAIRDWLAQRGIPYVYVITPNKHSIYTDKLPNFITKKVPFSATDQLVAHLRDHTDIVFVDMREALLQERQLHDVYYRLDSHWNSYGANAGQYEIMKAVEGLFPDSIRAFKLPADAFTIELEGYRDLAMSAGMEGAQEAAPQPVFAGMCNPVREEENADFFAPFTMLCDTGNLNAVIFRDSFFTALQPYTSRQFRRATYIWNVMNFDQLSEYVEREKPDLVIDQVVERVLPYVPRGQPFVEALQ